MTTAAFFVPDGYDRSGDACFVATEHTISPWGREVQHGGPPSALLGRALEQMPSNGARTIARVSVDLWGPVPVGPLSVATEVTRPGRTVELVRATLRADERVVAVASAWRFPEATLPVRTPETMQMPPGPEEGHPQPRPESWHGGYLDAVEWRWIHGAVMAPGPAAVWMRPRVPLLPGEDLSPMQRLLVCADSASGASAALDPAEWAFMNTEITVHVVRPPVGDWVCVDAETTLAGGTAGMASARLLDRDGLVGRSAQALLVTPR